ncbi:histidine phosphatase family protein [Paenibacillus sp. SC116]|uniref:histidine phosphatase family protein n=1 Tax=Paenibacillus sp. SC116 TaxID=2968986 RepID=UPI00215B26EF|nr:histidine phosphatase family protein [Paenibacillus sp. SC116]MCR8845918.1 histidine phosphatase family protein [Paenibacillus sp. SC116]
MTRIGIIRHGSTEWNKEGRAQGSSDIPLNESGVAEARQLANRLSKEQWDVIYTSPLSRARTTAEAIASEMNDVDVLLDDRLREVNGGLIEGTTEEERVAKWGADWRELDLGLEPKDQVFTRILSFVQEVTDKHAGQNVLLVSHGSFIRHLFEVLLPTYKAETRLKNTSVSNIAWSDVDDTWQCELYNCTVHVDNS